MSQERHPNGHLDDPFDLTELDEFDDPFELTDEADELALVEAAEDEVENFDPASLTLDALQPPAAERGTGALDAFEDGHVSPVEVARLSDLDRTALRRFRREWDSLPAATREEIVSTMESLAEDRVELRFERALRVALEDDEPAVRQRAIGALWEDESPDLIGVYQAMLANDDSDDVRAAAAQALGRFATLAVGGGLPDEVTDSIRQSLLNQASDAFEDYLVRRRALEAVGVLGDAIEVRDCIRDAMDEDDTGLQASALYAMGQSADRRWLPLLINELENSEPEIRYEAARACGALGDRSAVAELLETAKDEDTDVRYAAINALGAIGGTAARRALERLAREATGPDLELVETALSEVSGADELLQEPE